MTERLSAGQRNTDDATFLESGNVGSHRTLVIGTSNVALDPALTRRALVYDIPRPSIEARRALIGRWLPEISARDLDRCVKASNGLSPWDIEVVLFGLWRQSFQSNGLLTADMATRALRQATRTPAL